jgi:hypothetical protein
MSTREKEIPKVEVEEKASSKESTQQTKDRVDPPIEEVEKTEETSPDPKYVESLEQRLAEQTIQTRKLESLIDLVKKEKEEAKPKPKPRNIEEERKNFYEDPTGALDERDDKILRQMAEMLEPIKMVAASFQSDSEYKTLKMYIKQDPYFGKGLRDSDIEAAVDSIMSQPGVTMDENTIKSAISQAVGMKQMGLIGTKTTTTERIEGERTDPPHVRANRTRVTRETEVRKELTEDDRLAMKIAGLKPGNPEHEKQYWELIDDDTMVLDVHKKKEA